MSMSGDMAPNEPPLVSELAEDPEVSDLVEVFVSGLAARLMALERALESGEHDQLARLAHQLKGSAGAYGFPVITEAARSLEDGAKSAAQAEVIKNRFESLAGLCRRAVGKPSQV